MSLICKDCGGIFNRPCIIFNNSNNPEIINNHHYQIDKYGVLFPVFSNFLGFECWLNDNYCNVTARLEILTAMVAFNSDYCNYHYY